MSKVEGMNTQINGNTDVQRTVPVRKERIGTVVSDKMTKTIVVEVERRVPHPRFGKIVRVAKKFYAHDAEGKGKVGDRVRIRETRPLSRTKRWELVEILGNK